MQIQMQTQAQSQSEEEFTLINLERLLNHTDNTRGVPPDFFVKRGAAIVSVDDATHRKWHVTQNVLIRRGTKRCVVSIWPYSRVQSGYIALDPISMKTLNVPRSSLVTRMEPKSNLSTPSNTPKKSSASSGKKSSSKKKRNSLRSEDSRLNRFERLPFESPKNDTGVQLSYVRVHSMPSDIIGASSVQVEPLVYGYSGVEYLVALKCQLVGRILVQGMLVPLNILGVETSACIRTLVAADGTEPQLAIVRDFTTLTCTQSYNYSASQERLQKLPKLADVGGVNTAADKLLCVARNFLFGTNLRNVSLSSGALLHGPSGTGKTVLSTAVAGELGVHLEEIHGSALSATAGEVDSQRKAISILQAAFERAKTHAPTVLILNDIHVIARDQSTARNSRRIYNNQDENETSDGPTIAHEIAQLLDSRSATAPVFVIGTTKSIEEVDGTIRRVGRMDCAIKIEIPNANARQSVLRTVSRRARDLGKVDFKEAEGDAMARMAFGCVHADIAGVWNRAVSTAMKRDGEGLILREDVEAALALSIPSRLRDVTVEITRTRWSDIGGQELAKSRLRESVELPLSENGRAALAELRLQPPCGILLYGPPGCSKTLLARAVATESRANFVSVRGPELLSKWVGASEKAVHAVFERARAAAPAVVFFDEIDALASTRDGHAGASAHSRVVAQLLAEMDGISGNVGVHGERVVVIAATNRPDLLDPALLRPGRIDLQIYVGLPDLVERLAILQVHTRSIPLDKDVRIESLAEDSFTGGMSGAEIAAFVREAALVAMELDPRSASCVNHSHFEMALERRRPIGSYATQD